MGKLCTCNQNSSGAQVFNQQNAHMAHIQTASGARFLNKAELKQLSKFGDLSLPPKDIETLREFYFQRSLMQIRDPERLFDLSVSDVKPTSSKSQSKFPPQKKDEQRNQLFKGGRMSMKDHVPESEREKKRDFFGRPLGKEQDEVSGLKSSARGLNSSRMAQGKHETLINPDKTPQSSLNNYKQGNFSGRLMNANAECLSPQTIEENQNRSISMLKSSKDQLRKGQSLDQSAGEMLQQTSTEKRHKIVRYNLLDLKRQRDDSPANSLIRERQKMHDNATNQQFLQQPNPSLEGQSALEQQLAEQQELQGDVGHEMRGARQIYSSGNFLSREDNQLNTSQHNNPNTENDQQLFQFGEMNNDAVNDLKYTTKSHDIKKKPLQSCDQMHNVFEFRSHNFQIFQSHGDFCVQDIAARRSRLLQTNSWQSADFNASGQSSQLPVSQTPDVEVESAPIQKSRSSLFSWITQGNGYAAKKEQTNPEFQKRFQQMYNEIFGDFLSRIDELREIQSLCQIAEQFQKGPLDRNNHPIDPRRQNEYAVRMNQQYSRRMNFADLILSHNQSIIGASNDPTSLSPQQPTDSLNNKALSKSTANKDEVNDQQVEDNGIAKSGQIDAKGTSKQEREKAQAQQKEEEKEVGQESQARQESSFEINGTPITGHGQKSVNAWLHEEVDWKDLSDVEKQVGDFLKNSQLHFSQAGAAITPQKETLMVEMIFNQVLNIDQKIGKFEYDVSQCLQKIMDEYLTKAIADLYKQVCERPSKEETREYREEPNSECFDEDEVNQFIKEINRPSANNSKRSGRASGASMAQPSSGNYRSGSSIMKIAQGTLNHTNNSRSFIVPKNISLDSLGTSDEAANCEWQIKLIAKTFSSHFKKIFSKHRRLFPLSPVRTNEDLVLMEDVEGSGMELQPQDVESESQYKLINDKTPYKSFKQHKCRIRLQSKILEVEKEIETYEPINSEGQKNLQTLLKNLRSIKEQISSKENDLEAQYYVIADKINRQLIGVLRDKHQIQLIKIQQMHSVNSEDKKKIMDQILKDLNDNIGAVDYEFDEMKEQQLHVDVQIEEYFRQIDQYPQALKKLFDIGTELLQFFDEYYRKWYFFQCEVQQKLYNNIYSKEQTLIVQHLDNRHIHDLIRNVFNKFLELYQEYLAIRVRFDILEIEINAQYKMFFNHSFEITEQCLSHFDKIGIMDLQGDGALIRGARKNTNKQLSSNLNVNSPQNIHIVKEDIVLDPKTVLRKPDEELEGRLCALEQQVKHLCRNVTELNKLRLALNNYNHHQDKQDQMHQALQPSKESHNPISNIIVQQNKILNVGSQPLTDISTVEAKAKIGADAAREQQSLAIFYMPNYFKKYQHDKHRNQLNNQVGLTVQEFISQKFDQCFQYSQIQHNILSNSDDNPSIFNMLGGGPTSGPHAEAKPQLQSSDHQGVSRGSSLDPNIIGMNVNYGEAHSSQRPSDMSGGKQILSEDAALSVGQCSKESIEFDLFFDVCGIEMNVVQIKKKVRIQKSMLSKHMVGANIYKRELYLNINYFKEKQMKSTEQHNARANQGSGSKTQATKDDNSLNVKVGQASVLDFNVQDYQDVVKKKSTKSQNLISRQQQDRRMVNNNREQSLDIQMDRIQQMNLIPLGVAMHHLLQSPVMADLFNSLKKQCLNQIESGLKSIDQEIGGWPSHQNSKIDYPQKNKMSHSQSFVQGTAPSNMSLKMMQQQKKQLEQKKMMSQTMKKEMGHLHTEFEHLFNELNFDPKLKQYSNQTGNKGYQTMKKENKQFKLKAMKSGKINYLQKDF